MDKAKVASTARQLILIAVVYPACVVALLTVVTSYLEPPLVWLLGLLSWAAFTVFFIRFALGVKMRGTASFPGLRTSGKKK
jgi:hypothetical protein